jgi:hypothetical protein
VHFDRSLPFAEMCPRKQSQAQVDSSRIESIDGVFKVNSEIFLEIKSAGNSNRNCLPPSRQC